MNKIFFYIICLIGIVLLLRCSGSEITENSVINSKPLTQRIEVKDTTNKETELFMQSEITCPECGYVKIENMPSETCLIKYNCEKCNTTLYPKDDDCCVFCSYGTEKCPSKQDDEETDLD